MKITTNRANWSGKAMIINTNKKTREFTIDYLPGERFKVVGQGHNIYHLMTYDVRAWRKMAVIYRFKVPGQEAIYEAISGDISREDSDMFTAAAQLIANII